MKSVNAWFSSGMPWVWLTAAMVSLSMVMVVGLLLLIAARGLGHFWPAAVYEIEYQAPGGQVETIIGERRDQETVPIARLNEDAKKLVKQDSILVDRYLIKTGNRELLGLDFRWIIKDGIRNQSIPEDIMVIERYEWGNFYGYLENVKENGQVVAEGESAWEVLSTRVERAAKLHAQIASIEKHEMGKINYSLEQLRLYERRLELENNTDPANQERIIQGRADADEQYKVFQQQLNELYVQVNRDSFSVRDASGKVIELQLSKVVHIHRPNSMSIIGKIGFYIGKFWEFMTTDPREANTEGGIFPAIFGTVMMVLIMSVFATPFGVIAAIYLREYAKQGVLTRTIRIAVNNLAGVPSIVYGVFGLGFFVYFLGGNIDALFYPEAAPAPVFGSPGILWASLTLALLTVPVVIVATEEGLTRIPRAIREGSLALGATKAETLWRTVLPMASPAIMTGIILAVARAAGEVAPLMLVGVVKLAPSLVVDANAPFLHLERKFMHLGFHIYDVGFQSPNVEAARPLVYATAFLLVLVIVLLNLAAIWIRNRLRERYKALESV
ncbi:MAG: phosphate ABC transporter permease PstA [Pseudomonadota bacterium]